MRLDLLAGQIRVIVRCRLVSAPQFRCVLGCLLLALGLLLITALLLGLDLAHEFRVIEVGQRSAVGLPGLLDLPLPAAERTRWPAVKVQGVVPVLAATVVAMHIEPV